MRLEGAHEQFDFFTQKLNERELYDLRIEKGEKLYAVRLGKFENKISARKVLSIIKPLSPDAFIVRDTIEDKNIIRQYNRLQSKKILQTREKPLPLAKAEEVKEEVEMAYLKQDTQLKKESLEKPVKEITSDLKKKGYQEDSAISIKPDDQWTLLRCIDYAIQNNPDLQSSEAKIQASNYYYDFQRKLFFPRIDLNVSTGYLTGKPISPFAVLTGATVEGISVRERSGAFMSATLTLNVPILKEGVLFTKNAPAINIAEKQILINKSTYEVKKNDLTYAIGTSFFNLLKNREEIKTAEEHVKYLNVVHKITLSKYNEGLISQFELLKAAVQLASGEKELEIAKNLSKKIMSDLSIKMGLEPTREITISEEEFKLLSLPPLDKLINMALSNRYEIKAQELQMSIAQESVREAESQKYPNVDFVSTFGVANDYGSNSNSLWTSFLQLNMPVFDFGAIRSKIEGKKASVVEEERLLSSIKGTITQEVIMVLTNINNLRADITLKEKMVEQSMENTRLMRAKFDQDLTSLPSVLEAIYLLYEDQKKLIQSKYDFWIAYLQLIKATGSNLTSP